MSEQYFTNQPQSKSNPKTWNYDLRGHSFQFTSDIGVFSKNEVDFGSKTLIDTFEAPEIAGAIVDLGCGYGPIGLSIAKSFPNRHIIMSDVNERAIGLARENAKHNRIENVAFYLSDRFEQIPNQPCAAVLTNPPIRAGKKTVHQIFEDSYEFLEPEGELWVVIQKKQGAPSALKKIEALFSTVKIAKKQKGYEIIRATK
ncbi:16S rRNA (guanine1207-N2)-methyltransferase [Natronobacillus azotifigens]|uniref:Class I SAM-dependent methyltransferase n=1 Tax=Natronobacillus azotifigens TaxID=472978 RepID=A0A9J6RDN8_9BACI|nr:class I SAM-dependent methyltransferase [Natronobacillus azotifigens]MCZ0703486.1 class I SAM-dependent methyltransferase [Natronobacillus azotifigens]